MGLAGRAWKSVATRRWLTVAAGGVLTAGLVGLALWATSPGWLATTHGLSVAALGWARAHLLTVAVMTLVASVAVSFLVALRQRVWSQRDTADERRRVRDRQVMLARVRYRWITGVLDQSLANEARIRLGLERRPDTMLSSGMTVRGSHSKTGPLSAGTSINTVFDWLGGGLLILGAPGSGKTTALLELARALIKVAEADERQPMPVVFNLASWATHRGPVADWLVDELRNNYDVPRLIATQWVAAGEILPLLDGLDEVAKAHRADCVEAINAFHGEHGLVRFVICSRTEEYTTLANRLRAEDAVELQPATREQVADYLAAAGAVLADVQAALEVDETLWALLQSPLVLSIVALTYQGRSADALRVTGTSEQRLKRLWNAYVEQMLKHRPGRHTPAQILHWLSWLARLMHQRSQCEFHLDRLHPDWLPTTAHQRLATLGLATAPR